MNKRQQRKMMKFLVENGHERAFEVYGKEAVRSAYCTQYAWFIFYFFRKERMEPEEAGELVVVNAFRVVRNRRTCFKDINAAKAYIKLNRRTENEN